MGPGPVHGGGDETTGDAGVDDAGGARIFVAAPQSAPPAHHHFTAGIEQASASNLVRAVSLVTSEATTNSRLHAGTRPAASARAANGGAHVEVRDGSDLRPSARSYAASAVTGHGLWATDAVTEHRASAAWFDGGYHDTAPPAAPPRRPSTDLRPVRLLDLPPELVLATAKQNDALLREAALLAANAALPGGARTNWELPQLDLGPVLEAAARAVAEHRTRADVTFDAPAIAGEAAIARLALTDEAEALAARGELPVSPSLPEITECRKWLLGQIALQLRGLSPRPWRLHDPQAYRGAIANLAAFEPPLRSCVVVADGSLREQTTL